MQKVILFVDSLHSFAAGSERQLFKLAEGLVLEGIDVSVILLRHTEFTKAKPVFPCDIQSLEIYTLASLSAMRTLLQFRKKIQDENVDLIHAFFPEASLLAPLFCKSSSTKVITSRRRWSGSPG